MTLIPILIVIIIVITAVLIFYLIAARENKQKHKIKTLLKNSKDEAGALREAAARLKKNPNDVAALVFSAEHWYKASNWEKSLKNYETLSGIPNLPSDIDQGFINIRAAVCSLNMNMIESAFKYALIAYTLDPNNFEISYELGHVEFLRGNYEKALGYLKKSYTINPEYAPSLRLLGHTYFKLEKSGDALEYIRKSLALAPNDKSSVFTLAECYADSGQLDQAERIYSHLRPDPVWGPEACLRLGNINLNNRQDELAIENFTIGLKHKKIRPDISTELQYQLGKVLLNEQKITEALTYLQNVQSAMRGYKDTDALVEEYRELSANKNLQTFIMSPSAEFVALCRKIVTAYYPKARVKITKTQMNENNWADLVAEIDTPKWTDIAMFRFIRTQGAVGELVLRDFQFNLKNAKAGKGVCLGVCQFSDEAKRFTEARLIDLIEKERFISILKSLDLSAAG
jgi:tetratricopeptide (TPR) repeat protein